MRAPRTSFRGFSRRPRRGVIYILALGVLVMLSGIALVFAQEMRTETVAAANRQAALQADAIELGAEQWVLAQVETYPADAATITQIPAAGIPIGDGCFWVLHPDMDATTNSQNWTYAITDESSKLNLNSATSDQLMFLPSMTQPIADAIVDWRSSPDTPTGDGAESSYYESLQPDGYAAKNDHYETVEELLLVKDVDKTLLYGYDRNRDGVIDDIEQNSGGTASLFNSSNGAGRGLFNYLTVSSVEPNTTISGTARINVNTPGAGGAALVKVLTDSLTASRATAVLTRIMTAAGRRPTPFPTIGAFFVASTMTSDEFALVADQLTTSPATTLTGLVNVNTAPRQVLECLPGLTESDADALISNRPTPTTNGLGNGSGSGSNVGSSSSSSSATSSIAWIFSALTPAKAAAISGAVTTRSFQYSADIVAVSPDGRAFKRVRIIVDGRKTPAKIVYRRDLTSVGWPLPPDVRTSLRAGKSIPPDGLGGSNPLGTMK